ncbi:hypothetical protein MJO28_001265, partial [Puccinia striiformis f. sp. tritici]
RGLAQSQQSAVWKRSGRKQTTLGTFQRAVFISDCNRFKKRPFLSPCLPLKYPHPHQFREAPIVGQEMSSVPTTKILWVAFGLMTISTATQWVLTTRQQQNTKLLHHISLTLSTLTLVTYYFILTDIDVRGSSIWIRDLQWILTFPLVLVELGLISGVSIQDLVIMALNGIGMCVTGFLGTVQRPNRLRWPLVLMAWIFWLSIVREILTSGRRSSARNSARVARFFNYLAVYVVVLGSFYPIIWSAPVDPFLEIALFSILDMLTKPIFATWVLIGVSIIPESNVVGANRYIEARIWNSIGGNVEEQLPGPGPEP